MRGVKRLLVPTKRGGDLKGLVCEIERASGKLTGLVLRVAKASGSLKRPAGL